MTSRCIPPLRLAFEAPTTFHFFGQVATIASILLALTLGMHYRHIQISLAATEASLAATHQAKLRESRRGEVAPELRIRTAEELAIANEVIRRLSLPWEDLFAALESSTDDDVVLIAIEPDADAGSVIIAAEARTSQAMMDYGQRLMGSARFGDVRIQNHQVQVQEPQKPIRFTIAARWLFHADTSKRQTGGGR
ncbi:PilN domain-containing protein [Massilia horti]|uniref:PilN domain-containing protein n=1 Tax=Massilia horti TaxID=2562153 RepID=A0A4Y9T344_9BURK|nr:PilN domain-containing protein [Massilia horti]TFW34406.1 hypothetical protein E4O92_04180 [Massilia horti]